MWQPDSCLVRSVCVWYREAVCAVCFDELSHSSRKSSLPVEGGNVHSCDLWLFLLLVPYIVSECKVKDLSNCLSPHWLLGEGFTLPALLYFTVTMDPTMNLSPWCKPHMTQDKLQLNEVMKKHVTWDGGLSIVSPTCVPLGCILFKSLFTPLYLYTALRVKYTLQYWQTHLSTPGMGN